MRVLLYSILLLASARYFVDLEISDNYKILWMIGLAGFTFLTISLITI